MAKLFHFSEEPGIKTFHPRPPPSKSYKIEGNLVWAIDEEHSPNFLLPRDCPRVTYFAAEQTTAADQERFFGHTYAKRIIAVETAWAERIMSQRLIKYEFDEDEFQLLDEIAGYYISRNTIIPRSEVPINNTLKELLNAGVELRFMPLLWRLREAVIHSTLGFSLIRMRNATPPPEGLEAFYPLPE